MKVVINSCYGGFGLSHEAILNYAELVGITLYPTKSNFGYEYWLVPPEEQVKPFSGSWLSHSLEERHEYNQKYEKQVLSPNSIPRNNVNLVKNHRSIARKCKWYLCKVENRGNTR